MWLAHVRLAVVALVPIACSSAKPPPEAPTPGTTLRLAVVSKGHDQSCSEPCTGVRGDGETLVRCEKAWTRDSLRDRMSESVAFVCTFAR